MFDFLERLGHAVSIRISPHRRGEPFQGCVSLRPVIPSKLPVQGFEALLFAVATELANAIVGFAEGGIAQLVERLVRNEKVRGSNPLTSTPYPNRARPRYRSRPRFTLGSASKRKSMQSREQEAF
jgi:hypothetical protein